MMVGGTVTNDPIGDRMKSQYEDRTRYMLPRRTYTIIRLDGVAFHTYTKGMKPFNSLFTGAMSSAAIELAKAAQGFKLGYQQSDEISLLLTDFRDPKTAAWFDGNIQKIASVSASMATAAFNNYMNLGYTIQPYTKNGYFDARVFVIPDPVEVENYFVWRQKDAIRNSINSFAQQFFGPSALKGKSIPDVHQMLHEIGHNWATELLDADKNGIVIAKAPSLYRSLGISPAPVFLKDRAWLSQRIPEQWAEDKGPANGTV